MSPPRVFKDRVDAGRRLAERLSHHRADAPIVVGLPRGGVPVAYEVAFALDAPLDVCVVRKIGAPAQPELGIGAVAEDGALFVDRASAALSGVSGEALALLVEQKRAEVEARVRRFRGVAPPIDVRGRTVIVVDDGIATGGTVRAALQTLRMRGIGRVILAVPVAASETLDEIADFVDEVVCLHADDDLVAVGEWYEDFGTTTDDDVVELLAKAHGRDLRRRADRVRLTREREIRIPLGEAWLQGHLSIPHEARALVLFTHANGTSRESPRDALVAGELQRAGLATLAFDLLTAREARVGGGTTHLRADVELLASRLLRATEWARAHAEIADLPIGYLCTATDAAAALVAAAKRPGVTGAIVALGGRPDLAGPALTRVEAPTLFVVGGGDTHMLDVNRHALELLRCEKRVEIVPSATPLFEDQAAVEQAARHAAAWLRAHLHRAATAVAS